MAETKDDETTIPPALHSWLSRLEDHQRRTARAVADLARGHQLEARQARARHGELLGIALASLPGATAQAAGGELEEPEPGHLALRKRRDPSVRIQLPEGVTVELPRKKILGLSVTLLKAAWYIGVGLLVALHWLVEHWHALQPPAH
jgi:hypothetical protein